MRRKYEDTGDRSSDGRRSRKMKVFRNEMKSKERNRSEGHTRKIIEYTPHISVLKVKIILGGLMMKIILCK